MANKIHEIAFKIAGNIKGSFFSTFKDASKAVKTLESDLKKLNEAQEGAKNVASFGNKGIAAAAVAAGAGVAGLIKVGADYSGAMAQMQAQTGATNAEMQAFGQSAREIYKSGLGESFAEVSSAMANVKQVSGLTGDALKEVTSDALVLSKVFQFDINETARASSALMKKFGIDGKKAHDLIAYAAQNGANKNGDLLDTFNEYSVHYKALGFSAEQFTAHLVKGAQDGSFSIDKVGDAIKEFNIRAKDGSKSSAEGFAALGLDAQQATAIFAQGGEKANQAFFEVVQRLNEIEDPVKRNAAGVALFGTQFEDLESGALKSMLAIKDATNEANGAMEQVKGDSMKDLNTQLAIVGRSFTDMLIPAAQKVASTLTKNMPQITASMQKLAPILQKAGNAIAENIPAIINAISKAIANTVSFAQTIADNWSWIAPILKGVLATFIGMKVIAGITSLVLGLNKAFLVMKAGLALLNTATRAQTIAQLGLNLAFWTCPITWIVAGIAAVIAIGVLLWKNWDTIKAKTIALWNSFSSAFPGMASVISNWYNATIKPIISGVITAFKGVIDFVAGVFTGNWSRAWEGIKSIFSGVFGSLVAIAKAPLNGIIALVNMVINGLNSLKITVPDWVPGIGGKGFSFNIPQIPQLASGGIATKPTLAMIGEGNESEAVLPLSKLNSMIGGGTSGGGMGGGITINFSPVINVSGGGADAYSQAQRGVEAGAQNLKKELEKVMAEQRRLSYT